MSKLATPTDCWSGLNSSSRSRTRNLSVLQVNDGSTLWIRRDVDQLQSQAYVDLRRLREAATGAATSNPGRSAIDGHLAIGGLAQLLRSLSERFQFGTATASEISGIPMWELTGEWQKGRLAMLLPEQQDRIEAGPPRRCYPTSTAFAHGR